MNENRRGVTSPQTIAWPRKELVRNDLFCFDCATVKPEFHDVDTDTDTDILARILADTSDTRDWSYSCGKLNDTPTFSRRSSPGCRCRCRCPCRRSECQLNGNRAERLSGDTRAARAAKSSLNNAQDTVSARLRRLAAPSIMTRRRPVRPSLVDSKHNPSCLRSRRNLYCHFRH